MRLPLLLCMPAIALTGCNCDLDYCGSTSQSSQNTYQAQAASRQERSRQASNQVDLSGYGGMYSQVRLPENERFPLGSRNESQSSQSRERSTYPARSSSSRSSRSSSIISGASPELEARLSAEFASLPAVLQQATNSIVVQPGCSPHWGCDRAAATAKSPGAQIEIWRGGKGIAHF